MAFAAFLLFATASEQVRCALTSRWSPSSGSAREDAELSRLMSEAELPQEDMMLDVSSSSSSEYDRLYSELTVGNRLTCLNAASEE